MQAVVVAGICEFLGAVLLGASVAATIKSGIAQLGAFDGTPGVQRLLLFHTGLVAIGRSFTHALLGADLLMVGMMVVLLTTGLWLALATFLELPVSTSHSVGEKPDYHA